MRILKIIKAKKKIQRKICVLEARAYEMMDLIVSPEYSRSEIEARYGTTINKIKEAIIELEQKIEKCDSLITREIYTSIVDKNNIQLSLKEAK